MRRALAAAAKRKENITQNSWLKVYLWISVLACLGAYLLQSYLGTEALSFIDEFRDFDRERTAELKRLEFWIQLGFSVLLVLAMFLKPLLYLNILGFAGMFVFQFFNLCKGLFTSVGTQAELESRINYCHAIKRFSLSQRIFFDLKQCNGAVALGFFILALQVASIMVSWRIVRGKHHKKDVPDAVADVEAKDLVEDEAVVVEESEVANPNQSQIWQKMCQISQRIKKSNPTTRLWTSVGMCLVGYLLQAYFGTESVVFFRGFTGSFNYEKVFTAKLIGFFIQLGFSALLCVAMKFRKLLYINLLGFVVLFLMQLSYLIQGFFGQIDTFEIDEDTEVAPNYCRVIFRLRGTGPGVAYDVTKCRVAVAFGFFVLILQASNILLAWRIIKGNPRAKDDADANADSEVKADIEAKAVDFDVEAKAAI